MKGRPLIITLKQFQTSCDEWSCDVRSQVAALWRSGWVFSSLRIYLATSGEDQCLESDLPTNSKSNPSWRCRCDDQFGKLNLASGWSSNLSQVSRPPIIKTKMKCSQVVTGEQKQTWEIQMTDNWQLKQAGYHNMDSKSVKVRTMLLKDKLGHSEGKNLSGLNWRKIKVELVWLVTYWSTAIKTANLSWLAQDWFWGLGTELGWCIGMERVLCEPYGSCTLRFSLLEVRAALCALSPSSFCW